MNYRHWPLIVLLLLLFGSLAGAQVTERTARPWTYWWWMGSAVNKQDITRQLEQFAASGLGGVHIIPIYGAKGYEDQFLDFLSEPWMEMAAYTITEADRLGMGVDLSLGTGWPFGGPWVDASHAARSLTVDTFSLTAGSAFLPDPERLADQLQLQDVEAVFVTDGRRQYNLSPFLGGGRDAWAVPAGDWRAVVFGVRPTGQRVKRAAPGGEGLVVDYFDRGAVDEYLAHFDSVFSQSANPPEVRAIYHDSYEVYGAQWTEAFASAFRRQHGYDVRASLPLLADTYHRDRGLLLHDIRATISELLYESFARPWTRYGERAGWLTRYQAHGSPGNILDLYALATIPETESFGCAEFGIPGLACDPDFEPETFGRPSTLMTKFASSPAHLYGKPLVSSETGTWLGNHFRVSLRQVKPHLDQLFVGGVNHVFFHGSTYSPAEAGYPGWLFYASTNFGPTAHFSDELPLLNDYIERCQSALQAARPDNDVLLYFPIHDRWSSSDEDILLQLDVHHSEDWFGATPFGQTAEELLEAGYAFDYVSDRQLASLRTDATGGVSLDGRASYRAVVVPATTYLPEATLNVLHQLKRGGVEVIFLDRLPAAYPGLGADRRIPADKLRGLTAVADVAPALAEAGVRPESVKKLGLDYIRKRTDTGGLYFLTNLSDRFDRGYVTLSGDYRSIVLTDPLTGASVSIATRDSFFLELPPGKSVLVETSTNEAAAPARDFLRVSDTLAIEGPWTVTFDDTTGLQVRERYTPERLTSWTDWDEDLAFFTGKATYRTDFTLDAAALGAAGYRLTFDGVHESAEVILNGEPVGTVWAFPNELDLPANLLREANQLTIVVQNLSANYMRRYDREHPEWKNFYDINFVDITYRPFDAGAWPPALSGLTGRVRLLTRE
ncbi:alpha-L-rhamnosidase-like protein [Neolewinella xylanilytica]|uniref:Alpha-L-rhamnosidase-like protein n=1 Tax=Neolewinella xylanilytica TaxID=1514080 RepID=A0A2S6IAC0_9BACT|nr:glycosyl hydrolase [Neolewinella xylanilytica]PPK88422.1 alpha-L-rhamnosidase-like protein [Neolewinella xylanilytica]